MLHPSYNDLIEVVNSEVEPGEQPVVQSRYSIVIATAKRARQLVDEEIRSGISLKKKALSVAIDDLYKQRVKIVSDDKE
ncbi:MAG: DNA-directed RNA polymerase subunit omega [Johnsonella sp.]|nr:DNA-directed RNA polymerase subunit omega [Johnsonella sp.]